MLVKVRDLTGDVLVQAMTQAGITFEDIDDMIARNDIKCHQFHASPDGTPNINPESAADATWHCGLTRKPDSKAKNEVVFYGYDLDKRAAGARAVLAHKLGFEFDLT